MEDDGVIRNLVWFDEFFFKLIFEGYLILFLEVINIIEKKKIIIIILLFGRSLDEL